MRDTGPARCEQADLLVVEDDAMGGDDRLPEDAVRGEHSRPRRAGGVDEQVRIGAPGAVTAQQIGDLGRALREVGGQRQPELGTRSVELERH